jgi:hypothetical protein
MQNLQFKRFDLLVTAPDKPFAQEFELDKSVGCIKGIHFTSDREDLMFYRGTQKIEINGKEYFPEDYESKLLMSSVNVPPNFRYYNTGNIEVINGKIKVSYTDKTHPLAFFQPYRVSLYVKTELKSA